ncbi:MAG: hypothetical protein JNG85_13455 [Spirochaetaceae bacterium]|nr:hypothetical protein [Spirochaetaceae bacterium]
MAGSTESKIFAVFGAILDDGRYARFSLSTLYAYLGPLGVTPEAARLVLSRMARKGYLASRRKGRASWYSLAAEGEAEVERAVARSVRRREEGPWDGRFRLVSYEIPEAERTERAKLASALEAAGYARVGSGLWAAAVDPEPRLRSLLDDAAARGFVSEFSAEYRGESRAFAARLFRLRERAAGIEDFRRRYAVEAEAIGAARAAGRGPGDAACFARYFEALTDYVAQMCLVPPLPRELLPEDWPGPAAEAAYARFRDEVRDGTNAYITAHYQAFEA